MQRLAECECSPVAGTGPWPLLSALGGAGIRHSTKTCREHVVVFCELGSGPGPALSATTEHERSAQGMALSATSHH